jgi:hypothetical protein
LGVVELGVGRPRRNGSFDAADDLDLRDALDQSFAQLRNLAAAG